MNELAPNKIELANGMLADIKHLEITLLNKKLEYSKYCFENGVLDLTHLKAVICQPRQVLMYYLHRIFNDLRVTESGNKQDGFLSLKEIGNIFDNKDHSTIIHSIRKVESCIQQPEWNPFLHSFYVKLKDAIFSKIGVDIK
jgi:hypothetical protein